MNLLEQAEEAYILAIREGIVLPEMTDEAKIEWYERQLTDVEEIQQPL